MTDYDTYGTSTHTASELVRLVTGHLDVVFTERESDYRGVYHLAQGTYGRIEIQPNAIPGDDDQDDLYTPEHSAVQVLLLTNTPAPEPTLHIRLGAIQGLVHLSRESWRAAADPQLLTIAPDRGHAVSTPNEENAP